tara:strand:+ start:429 stop:578 length:150 start_codon:yes stop_codon:yes gene_type:complete
MTHLAAYIFHQKRKRQNLENSGISEAAKQKLKEKYYGKEAKAEKPQRPA